MTSRLTMSCFGRYALRGAVRVVREPVDVEPRERGAAAVHQGALEVLVEAQPARMNSAGPIVVPGFPTGAVSPTSTSESGACCLIRGSAAATSCR